MFSKEKLNQIIINALKFEASDHGGQEHSEMVEEALKQFEASIEPPDAVTDKELARSVREVALNVAEDINDICICSDSLVTDNGESGYWVECSVFVPYPDEN